MERWSSRALRVLLLFCLALFIQGGFLLLLGLYVPPWQLRQYEAPVRVQVLDVDGDLISGPTPESDVESLIPAPEEPEEEPEPPPEVPRPLDGQIVDTPPPVVEKVPLQSDYLAEHNNAVPDESRTLATEVNPEVITDTWSRDAKVALEQVEDVGATEQSTGATVGSVVDDQQGKGPPRSALPSNFTVTNKEGIAAPMMSSSRSQSVAGQPQNDLLDEKLRDRVALNTREWAGAAYMNRIRQQVNHYWKQNLDNLPASVRFAKSAYETEVDVVLNADGGVERITVTTESGLVPLDEAVVSAFRIAGPFPNPPAELIGRDGQVYLPDMSFTVQLGHAEAAYSGIDPNQDVQFPGIIKSSR